MAKLHIEWLVYTYCIARATLCFMCALLCFIPPSLRSILPSNTFYVCDLKGKRRKFSTHSHNKLFFIRHEYIPSVSLRIIEKCMFTFSERKVEKEMNKLKFMLLDICFFFDVNENSYFDRLHNRLTPYPRSSPSFPPSQQDFLLFMQHNILNVFV